MTDNFKNRFLTALWEDYLYTDNFKDTVIYKHIFEKEYNRALQCKISKKPGTSDLSRLILLYENNSKGDFFLGLMEFLSASPKTFFEKKQTSRRDASLQDTFLDELFRFFNEGAVQNNIFNKNDIPSLSVPIKESLSGVKNVKVFIKKFSSDLSRLSKEKLKTISKKIDTLEKKYPFMEEIYETLMCIGIQYKFISEFLYDYGATVSEQKYDIEIENPKDKTAKFWTKEHIKSIKQDAARPILVFDKTKNSRKKDDTLSLITHCFKDSKFLKMLFPEYSTNSEQTFDQVKETWINYHNRYMDNKKAPDFYDFNYADYAEAFTLLTKNAETGVGLYILGCEYFCDKEGSDLPLPFLPAILSIHDFFDEETKKSKTKELFANRSYIFNTKYNGDSVLNSKKISELISSDHPEEILAAYYIKYTEAIEEAKELL